MTVFSISLSQMHDDPSLTLKLASTSVKTLIFPLSWKQTRLQQKQNYWGKARNTNNYLQAWYYTQLLLYLLCWSSVSLSLTRTFSSFRSCKNSFSRSTSMSSIMSSKAERGNKCKKKNSYTSFVHYFFSIMASSCPLLPFSTQKPAKCWINDKQCLVFHWHGQRGFYI